jgi:formiminoglutamate deiminase
VLTPPDPAWWCELAWLGGSSAAAGVLVEVAGDRITAVRAGVAQPPPGAQVLRGLTIPGLVNAHSHAFHRALRGRTHGGRGSFWTWREQMYAVADRLDPDGYFTLARAVFAEMACAGITTVGEFHYLHHAPAGRPYDSRNAMGEAVIAAAADAGVRLTLLDTLYLSSGFGDPVDAVQRRFSDGDAATWVARVEGLRPSTRVRIGAAVHSVRAVPRADIATCAQWVADHQLPLHVHVSEQPAENQRCLEVYGRSPVALLDDCGALGERTTAVHATHLNDADVAMLGASRTGVCMCPTTERDLADGIGPARRLADAGSPISLGSDSSAVIDLFEEARAVELDERLATLERGHWEPAELLEAATAGGATALGWPDCGRIAEGALADFVTVATDTPRLAGFEPEHAAAFAVFAATAADVRDVVVGGERVVRMGHHSRIDVGAALADAIGRVRAG